MILPWLLCDQMSLWSPGLLKILNKEGEVKVGPILFAIGWWESVKNSLFLRHCNVRKHGKKGGPQEMEKANKYHSSLSLLALPNTIKMSPSCFPVHLYHAFYISQCANWLNRCSPIFTNIEIYCVSELHIFSNHFPFYSMWSGIPVHSLHFCLNL